MTAKCTVCGKKRKACEWQYTAGHSLMWAICFPCWHARERGEFAETLKQLEAAPKGKDT